MSNSTDPSDHRAAEQEFVQHVQKMLADPRLRVDTTKGRKPVTTLIRDISATDRSLDLKRTMSEMNRPDRDLEKTMPVGESVEAVLSQKWWGLFKQQVGRIRAVCVSPTRQLLGDETPKPLTTAQVHDVLRQIPPPVKDVPSTIVLMSTGGFSLEAHEAAERRADRTVILVEPNESGGWNVWGPTETQTLNELFNPEAEGEKRQRVREAIEASKVDLLSSGVSTDRIAAKTQLPLNLVEQELKAYAKQTPGMAARRLDGKLVVFRQSTGPAPVASSRGTSMPLYERMKTLFARKGDTEKKIEFLAERRAALSQQRDTGYEEMGALETRESELRTQFKEASGDIAKRRLTSQLLQLRKDIERRQQLLSVLNQQINVVATHLHNLELVNQGKSAHLPDSEEMATDAAAAEEVLADLQANYEMADSVGSSVHGGMSPEEIALFEELEKEGKAEKAADTAAAAADHPSTATTPPAKQSSAAPARPLPPIPEPSRSSAPRRTGEAEPG